MTLTSARSLVHQVFVALALLLTVYVALVAFGVLREDVSFAATVAMTITILTSILAIRDLLDRRLEGQRGAWWTAMLCLAVLALVMGAIGGGYCAINMGDIIVASPFFKPTPMIMGALLLAGVVIASWLHWGWILPGIVLLSIVYFFYGQGISIPSLAHPPYDTGFIMNYLALDPSQGLYLFFHVLTSDLYFLILFGAVLVGIGVVRLFIEVGNAVGARVSGGAAFPAIIASGVLGSILAQAVASTTIIGRLTIPTMKKAGYSASMAGAIETLAATSGQLMPPILGLAAFIMAALLNLRHDRACRFRSGNIVSGRSGVQRHELFRTGANRQAERRRELGRHLATAAVVRNSVRRRDLDADTLRFPGADGIGRDWTGPRHVGAQR
jgi:TRAP-type uncharacterized transport system fused permease subunit